MTDCEIIIEMLSAYYDGELSADDTRLVREHLDLCGSCSGLLTLFGDVTGTLRDGEPPAELLESVMKSVLKMDAPRRAVNTRRIILRRIVPAAACLAVILAAIPLVRGIGGKSKAPESAQMYDMMSMATPMPSDAMLADVDEDSSVYGDVAENFRAKMAEPEEGYVYDSGNGAGEPQTFSGGADNAQKDGETAAAQPSTEPSAPDGLPIPAETPPPQLVPDMTLGGSGDSNARAEDFSVYYAVIKLAGEAPTMLDGYDRVDTGEGDLRIYVPRDVARALIDEGCDYMLYNADAGEAVVILSVDVR